MTNEVKIYWEIQYRDNKNDLVESDGCSKDREFFHRLLDEFLNSPLKDKEKDHLIFEICKDHN